MSRLEMLEPPGYNHARSLATGDFPRGFRDGAEREVDAECGWSGNAASKRWEARGAACARAARARTEPSLLATGELSRGFWNRVESKTGQERIARDEPPPWGGRWSSVYAAVLCYLLLLITGLYALTRIFRY